MTSPCEFSGKADVTTALCRVDAYFPVKFALRFSTKAATPSR